jgi:hypothetical protein
MNTWKVFKPKVTQAEFVCAVMAETTAAGDLRFFLQDGELKIAFAKGTWNQCELINASANSSAERPSEWKPIFGTNVETRT